MKKLTKILIFLILIGIVINITLTRYITEKSDMSSLIGKIWSGGQISTYNYAAIVNNFEYYLSFIEKENYEEAYKFITYEYKTYKTYDEYVENIKNIDYSNYKITDIIRRTENAYSLILSDNSNEKIENLMIFNKDNTAFTITPEAFIEYRDINETIKNKNVEYSLISTINYIDKFVANITITNLSKKDIVEISNIELIQNDVKHLSRKYIKSYIKPK